MTPEQYVLWSAQADATQSTPLGSFDEERGVHAGLSADHGPFTLRQTLYWIKFRLQIAPFRPRSQQPDTVIRELLFDQLRPWENP